MIDLLAIGTLRRAASSTRDPVEQVDDEPEGGVVEREAGAQPLDPGRPRPAGRGRTTAGRPRRGARRAGRGRRAGGPGRGAARRPRRTSSRLEPRPARTSGVASRAHRCLLGSKVETRRRAPRTAAAPRRLSCGGTMIRDLGVQVARLCPAGWAGRGRAAAAAGRSTCPAGTLHLGLAARGVDRRPMVPSAASHGASGRSTCRSRPVDPVPRVRRDPDDRGRGRRRRRRRCPGRPGRPAGSAARRSPRPGW